MIKLTQVGVGTESHTDVLRDLSGNSLLPIQAHSSDGATTFRVTGRVSPDAPWIEVIAPGTADFLQAISYVPFVQLEVTAGTGTVDLWVAQQ